MTYEAKIKDLISKGNTFDEKGDKFSALKYYTDAYELDKNNHTVLVNLALITYELGKFEQSEAYSFQAFKINPEYASTLINLGNIFYQKKEYQKALSFYQKTNALEEDNFLAKINLANAYFHLNDFTKSIEFSTQAVKINPGSFQAYLVLANAHMELENFDKALEYFLSAEKLDSQDPWVHNYLSQIYQKKSLWNEALRQGLTAVEKSGGNNNHHINFSYLLYECTLEYSSELAKEYAQKWQKIYGKNPLVSYAFSALNNQKLSKADSEYVRNIFDVFADSFDETLQQLDYQAPLHIQKFLQSKNLKNLTILDAGCGTGLCGSFLKKYAKKASLSGVDLSPKMLEIARKKGFYDELFEKDIESFLEDKTSVYDLIISSDVLTYIGELQNIISLFKKSLKKDGLLLFTISENNLNDEGFFLDKSGRFLHQKKYLKSLLLENGFSIDSFQKCKLRDEGDKEVTGFLVSAFIR